MIKPCPPALHVSGTAVPGHEEANHRSHTNMSLREPSARTFLLVAGVSLFLVSCSESKAFRKAREKDSIPAYREFLDLYPESSNADEAYRRVEDLYFKQAKKERTPESIDRYLKEYPKGRHAKQAETLRRQLVYEAATTKDTPEGYKNFLRLYPEGSLSDDVRNRLEE